MNRPGWTVAALLRLGAGLIVWASAFVLLYTGFSLGCQLLAPPPEDGLINPVTSWLTVLAIVHLFALLVLGAWWWKRPVKATTGEEEASRMFRHRVEGLVLISAIAGLVWIAFPIFMVAPCIG